MDELLFYDIEVFKYDSLVVFKDIKNNVIAKLWNSQNEDFAEPNGFEAVPGIIKDKTLVGYNNYGYDDYVLTVMLKGFPQKYIKSMNDNIIQGKGPNVPVSNLIHSIDTMQQIDFNGGFYVILAVSFYYYFLLCGKFSVYIKVDL